VVEELAPPTGVRTECVSVVELELLWRVSSSLTTVQAGSAIAAAARRRRRIAFMVWSNASALAA
jgi:hypothetical protein